MANRLAMILYWNLSAQQEMAFGTKKVTDLKLFSMESLSKISSPKTTKFTKKHSNLKEETEKTLSISSEQESRIHTVLKSTTSSSLKTARTTLKMEVSRRDISSAQDGWSSRMVSSKDGTAKTKCKSDLAGFTIAIGLNIPTSVSLMPTEIQISSKSLIRVITENMMNKKIAHQNQNPTSMENTNPTSMENKKNIIDHVTNH